LALDGLAGRRADFEPVGWGQGDGVFDQLAEKTGENVGEVFLGVDHE